MRARKRAAYKNAMRMGSLNLLVLVISLCLAILAVLALASAASERNLSERQQQTIEQRNARELAGQSILYKVTESSAGSGTSLLDDEAAVDDIAETSASLAQNRSGCAIAAEAKAIDIDSLKELVLTGENLPSALGGTDAASAGAAYTPDGASDHSLYGGEEMAWETDSSSFGDAAGDASPDGDDDGDVADTSEGSATGQGETDEGDDEEVIADARDARDVPVLTRQSGEAAAYISQLEEALSKCSFGISAAVESADGNMLHILMGIPDEGTPIVFRWTADREWNPPTEALWTPEMDLGTGSAQ